MKTASPLLRLIKRCRSWLANSNGRPAGALVDSGLPKARPLTDVAKSFIDGFSIASSSDFNQLKREIDTMATLNRGVGYEGAAAAKALLDLTTKCDPGYLIQVKANNEDWQYQADMLVQAKLAHSNTLISEAENYSFMIYLGIGEAIAQLRLPPVLCNEIADQHWSGQILDGYGFFDGYFNWYDSLVRQAYPRGLKPELQAFYDQGLGRAIYFISNCNAAKIRDYINSFAPERRRELWSGVGIPTAYVGGLEDRDLKKLLDYAGEHRAEVMQGVLSGIAARNQQRSVIPNHTKLACNLICGMDSAEGLAVKSDLERILQTPESYIMYEWQTTVRAMLKKEAC